MTNPAQCPDDHADFIRFGSGDPGASQVVLVPGIDVPLFALDLPSGLRGHAREQVAWRQLADRMGLRDDDVDMRPFTVGSKLDDWNHVLVTDAAHLARWRDLACRAVLPDYLSLPTANDIWTIAQEDVDNVPIVMARLGPTDGFSAEPEIAHVLLEQALVSRTPKALLLSSPLPDIETLALEREIPIARSNAELAKMNLAQPQVLAHDELSCDLLMDPQAARARLTRRLLPWRWPLVVSVLAAGLWAAAQWVAIERIEARTEQLAAETQSLVRQHFVTSGPILDIRLQVSRALSQAHLSAQTQAEKIDPLDLARRAGEVIAEAGAQPDLIGYSQGDGVTLILRLADFATADNITAALVTEGLQAELIESRVSDASSGVRAEIRIAAKETPN